MLASRPVHQKCQSSVQVHAGLTPRQPMRSTVAVTRLVTAAAQRGWAIASRPHASCRLSIVEATTGGSALGWQHRGSAMVGMTCSTPAVTRHLHISCNATATPGLAPAPEDAAPSTAPGPTVQGQFPGLLLPTMVPASLPRQLHTSASSPSSQHSSHHQHHGTPAAAAAAGAATTCGYLELIMGAMFAGKTTTLLKRAREEAGQGKRVLVLKSAKDTRYSATHVVSHDGDELHCFPTHSLLDFRQRFPEEYVAAHVVAIDEAQFFPDLAAFATVAADTDRKRVIVAGLDGDFKRQRFGQMLDLVPLADRVVKLAGRCHHPGCTAPALFTLRTATDDRQELIGGADLYQAACRAHYVQKHVAVVQQQAQPQQL